MDGNQLDSSAALRDRVCILGGGAAGIVASLTLADLGIPNLLVESGGFEFDEAIQQLYSGHAQIDRHEVDSYLLNSRLRFFGGATNHWKGYCHPLDALDFEQRSWVADSGWPFGRDQLRSYYERACPFVDVAPFPSEESKTLGESVGIQTILFQQSPPTRLGQKYRERVLRSSRIRLLTNANVTHLQASPNGTRIESARLTNNKGKSFRIEAENFVLALGAIESARLMLHSSDVHARGLGNAHDVVGRYFMDHRYSWEGAAVITRKLSSALDRLKADHKLVNPLFAYALPIENQRKQKLLNFHLYVKPSPAPLYDADKIARIAKSSGLDLDPTRFWQAGYQIENSPRRENRITLSHEKDRFEIPKVKLIYQGNLQEASTFHKSLEMIGAAFVQQKLGRLHLNTEYMSADRNASNHNLGTLRMGTLPKTSVVNPDGRVHDISNLYVAGAAVFPTGGAASPTMTVIALTLRLAEHLKKNMLT